LRILILNYEYPPLGGGAGVVSKYHAEGLAVAGNGITVVTTWFKGEKEDEHIGNLRIIKLKSKRKLIHKSTFTDWLSWIKKSRQFLNIHLQSSTYDYCFAHFALPGGEVARYINRKFKIPYSIISHGQDIPWFFPKQMFKYHLITYLWIKKICWQSDKLILLSAEMKKNADRFMRKHSEKNLIIPNGCDTEKFKPDYSKRKNVLKILYIGRLVAQKDPFTFLKSIKILSEKNQFPFLVNILGDGPLLKKMKTFCKKNQLENIIEFKAWIDKNEMLDQYQSSHIQVISSKAEAMSMSALEALSTGLYLISTPVSGNTDMIEQKINGEFFEFDDFKSLAEKICNFYREKFLKNYVVPNEFLEQFSEKFDWKGIVVELNRVCNNYKK
jgi:glycosyltransferase involved in cell wall biosynthesis